MRIVQVKCPKCGRPSFSKLRDSVVFCEECGTLHTRTDAGPSVIDFEIAGFAREAQMRRVHMPFWRLFSTVTIHSEEVSGGWVARLVSAVSGAGRGGNLFIFVPAVDLPPPVYKHWAQQFTTNPPQYRAVERFQGERLPTTIDDESARKLADFLILSFEAEKPGVLQDIKYDVAVQHSKLIYLPFFEEGGQYQSAL
ncbi:MAG: zinc ribbon domain-containing protein [Thermoplasmatota archaeon]